VVIVGVAAKKVEIVESIPETEPQTNIFDREKILSCEERALTGCPSVLN